MPDTPDNEYLWEWIRNQQNPLSGLGIGILEEIKRKDFKSEIANNMENIVLHGNQSGCGVGIKPSSMEWAALKVIKNLPNKIKY